MKRLAAEARQVIHAFAILAAFVGGCVAALGDFNERFVEKRRAREIPEAEYDFIPVLTYRAGNPISYRIVYRHEIEEETLVDDPALVDEFEINKQIAESLGIESGGYNGYKWLEVVDAGEGWLDLRVEWPTLRDYRHRVWYRIQDGEIVPQRSFRVSHSGILVYLFPFPMLAGLACAFAMFWMFRGLSRRR